jgi:hypothetical protein
MPSPIWDHARDIGFVVARINPAVVVADFRRLQFLTAGFGKDGPSLSQPFRANCDIWSEISIGVVFGCGKDDIIDE